jgi:hypothetical protein
MNILNQIVRIWILKKKLPKDKFLREFFKYSVD